MELAVEEENYDHLEVNLQRLLKSSERLATDAARELAVEATSTNISHRSYGKNQSIKSSYKYVDEIARMLELATAAREQYELKEAGKRHVPSSPSPSLQRSPSNAQLSGLNIKMSKEPPKPELLEEYRRKLSFLANLLNAPRWQVPHNEAAINRVTRNLLPDHNQQMMELETAGRVQKLVNDEMRQQLTLARLNPSRTLKQTGLSDDLHFATLSTDSAPFTPRSEMWDEEGSIVSNSTAQTGSEAKDETRKEKWMNHQDGTFIDQDSSSVDQNGNFIDQDGSSIDQDGSFIDQNGSFIDEDESSTSSYHDAAQSPSSSRSLWNSGSRMVPQRKVASSHGDNAELGDLRRLLDADRRVQDELTDELVLYAAAMKESAIKTGLKLHSDAKDIDKMSDKVESNVKLTQNASATVGQLLNTTSSSIWAYWSTLSTVLLIFVIVYIFILFVPKPSS